MNNRNIKLYTYMLEDEISDKFQKKIHVNNIILNI